MSLRIGSFLLDSETMLTCSILSADHGDTDTTLIYSGRPLRVRQTDYVKSWNNRQDEM